MIRLRHAIRALVAVLIIAFALSTGNLWLLAGLLVLGFVSRS